MKQCHHTDADDIPAFLCRRCHPELNLAPDKRAELDAADRAKRAERSERERKGRELRQAETRLASMTTHGEPFADSVNGKIAAALRAKIVRLESEGAIK